nr:DegT/DnrJ/EryC1/StrS family aminotransferase [Micromonospora sp. DSM 115978]
MTYRITLADNTVGTPEIEAVADVLTSRWLSAGAVTEAFEAQFAAALGVPDAVAVSSGTAALHLAVLALGVRPGDEVIVPSLSFVASAAVVALHGGVPVFADVTSADDPTIAPGEVDRLISDRTRAVVVMHYGGSPAATARVVAIARPRGIAVIEDAAHAPLVATGAGHLGTIGDIGCFSFFATKNVTTGEGGMVVARDRAILERIRSLRSHCVSRSTWQRHGAGPAGYDVTGIGLNYRPTEISSALGRVQLGRLAADRAHRRTLVDRYGDKLAGVPEVVGWHRAGPGDSALHLMWVLLRPGVGRDGVRKELASAGIQTSVHYPPTHLLSHYRDPVSSRVRSVAGREHLPVTEDLADRLLSLPLHGRMTPADVDEVVAALRAAGAGR